jgi:spore coat polysaccharide biosynthesis protein SpsF
VDKKLKIVATVECRKTSSRLHGKILMEAGGKPMLQILAERLLKVPQLDEVVLATTVNQTDDPVEKLADSLGVKCFRGSEDDVLKRVLDAAKSVDADLIVEITGDCPFIDPEIVSQVIDLYLLNDCDYASNLDPVCYPIGFDAQVFKTELLALADREGVSDEDREHVSWFIRRQPERFRKLHLPAPPELHWPELGITLDEKADYELLKKLYEELSQRNENFSCYDIIRYLRANPELLEINQGVQRVEVE